MAAWSRRPISFQARVSFLSSDRLSTGLGSVAQQQAQARHVARVRARLEFLNAFGEFGAIHGRTIPTWQERWVTRSGRDTTTANLAQAIVHTRPRVEKSASCRKCRRQRLEQLPICLVVPAGTSGQRAARTARRQTIVGHVSTRRQLRGSAISE